MTIKDTKRALTVCGHTGACAECPLGKLNTADNCMRLLMLNALDAIHAKEIGNSVLRQRVEELTAENKERYAELKTIEEKTVKKFYNNLKKAKVADNDGEYVVYLMDVDEIKERF